MPDFFSSILVFILTLVGIVLLGFAAGLSPSLYIAQTDAPLKKERFPYLAAFATGVLIALLALVVLFQAVQLDILLQSISSPVQAVILSVIFNIFIGIGLIVGGFWYINHQSASKPDITVPGINPDSFVGTAGFGFIRTFVSISGVIAAYLAGNAIASASTNSIEQAIYTAIFMAAAIFPLAAFAVLIKRGSARLESLIGQLQLVLLRVNYRLTIGAGAVIFGGSIVIFHLMMSLFY